MANKCPHCEWKIKPGEEVKACSKCGAVFHKWCFENISKCSVCGELTPFGLRIEARKNNIEINTTNANPQSTTEATQKQNAQASFSAGVHYVQDNINNKLNNEETGMFANIGEKIKAWAKAITVIGIISGIITFFAMFLSDEDLFFAALLAGVGAAITAYTTSLLLYAFGELVANSKESKEIQRQMLAELKRDNKNQNK